MSVTRAELRTRAQRRADMENSDFVSDAEWNDYINEGLAELHDIIVGKHEDYLVSQASIPVANGQAAYSLPADFYKERAVDLESGGQTYTLHPFMFAERNRFQFANGALIDAPYQYQIVGSELRLIPTPGSGTLRLWYVPQAEILTADGGSGGTISAAYANGWDRYVVLYAAIRALRKEDTDTNALMAEIEGLRMKIESAAGMRNAGEPKRIVDTRYARPRRRRW